MALGHGDNRDLSSEEIEVEEGHELLMHNYHTLPGNCKKYWSKRYSLFSKFDDGIYMTSELWYSVTPEEIGIFMARLVLKAIPKGKHILDVCCGAGGNAIQFANYFSSVGCLDISTVHVNCTLHNAFIYGVQDNIWAQVDDWDRASRPLPKGSVNQDWIPPSLRNEINPNRTFDFIFSSPPWGGPSYAHGNNTFDVILMQPFLLPQLCYQFRRYSEDYGFFLPRSLKLEQIRRLTIELYGEQGKCRIIYTSLENRCKGIFVLFGPRVTSPLLEVESVLL